MRRLRGFTLTELLITMAVFGILAIWAVPSFRNIILNNSLTAYSNAIASSVMFARSEAVTRRANIAICASNNGSTCSGSFWEIGWIVFIDSNDDGSRSTVAADGEVVLYHEASPDTDITIRGTNFSNSYISYDARGRLKDMDTGTLVVCDPRGNTFAKGLNIGASGRADLATDTDGNDIINISSGSLGDVTCP